ncbi:MAG: UDP-3-O-(3-hydroxymyristoyl)glucosamine N-acyltransferase [Bacteroidetes bacterium]|nr:UDP-3-O-(3-hydroxymyristoyl)glucosamine N-acyltransferase [Bacteroidota bacterium]
MQITVRDLSLLLNGEVVGNPDAILSTVTKIEEGKPEALSFLANPKYESYIYTTGSTAVLVNRTFEPSQSLSTTLIKVDDAYSAFTFLLEQFASISTHKTGIETGSYVSEKSNVGSNVFVAATAYISAGASVGNNSKIYPQVYIGDNAKVGNNCIIFAGVKIYNDCVIGDNCIIHAGTVIGSDGFGFAPQADKSYKKIPQIGNVIIENDVEIGSNCSIDRATMGSTIIRKGVKLDNLVQVAHNVEIGEHTVIASQSGIAGSSKIGKYCVLAGQVGVVGHITIADGTVIGGQSGVNSNIKKPNLKWFGSPAFEYGDSLKSSIIFRKLPDMMKRLRELEKQIVEINIKK